MEKMFLLLSGIQATYIYVLYILIESDESLLSVLLSLLVVHL